MPTRKQPSPFPYHLVFPCGLERRWLFVTCFTFLCIAFVPVIADLIFVLFICSVSGLLASYPDLAVTGGTIYTAIFISLGFYFHRRAMRICRRFLRHCTFILVLLLPITSSFARVLTYSRWNGSGGTYTFWEAVDRYLEKKKTRHQHDR